MMNHLRLILFFHCWKFSLQIQNLFFEKQLPHQHEPIKLVSIQKNQFLGIFGWFRMNKQQSQILFEIFQPLNSIEQITSCPYTEEEFQQLQKFSNDFKYKNDCNKEFVQTKKIFEMSIDEDRGQWNLRFSQQKEILFSSQVENLSLKKWNFFVFNINFQTNIASITQDLEPWSNKMSLNYLHNLFLDDNTFITSVNDQKNIQFQNFYQYYNFLQRKDILYLLNDYQDSPLLEVHLNNQKNQQIKVQKISQLKRIIIQKQFSNVSLNEIKGISLKNANFLEVPNFTLKTNQLFIYLEFSFDPSPQINLISLKMNDQILMFILERQEEDIYQLIFQCENQILKIDNFYKENEFSKFQTILFFQDGILSIFTLESQKIYHLVLQSNISQLSISIGKYNQTLMNLYRLSLYDRSNFLFMSSPHNNCLVYDLNQCFICKESYYLNFGECVQNCLKSENGLCIESISNLNSENEFKWVIEREYKQQFTLTPSQEISNFDQIMAKNFSLTYNGRDLDTEYYFIEINHLIQKLDLIVYKEFTDFDELIINIDSTITLYDNNNNILLFNSQNLTIQPFQCDNHVLIQSLAYIIIVSHYLLLLTMAVSLMIKRLKNVMPFFKYSIFISIKLQMLSFLPLITKNPSCQIEQFYSKIFDMEIRWLTILNNKYDKILIKDSGIIGFFQVLLTLILIVVWIIQPKQQNSFLAKFKKYYMFTIYYFLFFPFEGFMLVFIFLDIKEVTDEKGEMFSTIYAYIHLLWRILIYVLLIIQVVKSKFNRDQLAHQKYYPLMIGYREKLKMDYLYEPIQYSIQVLVSIFIVGYNSERQTINIFFLFCTLCLSVLQIILRPWSIIIFNYIETCISFGISITLCIIIIDQQEIKCNLCENNSLSLIIILIPFIVFLCCIWFILIFFFLSHAQNSQIHIKILQNPFISNMDGSNGKILSKKSSLVKPTNLNKIITIKKQNGKSMQNQLKEIDVESQEINESQLEQKVEIQESNFDESNDYNKSYEQTKDQEDLKHFPDLFVPGIEEIKGEELSILQENQQGFCIKNNMNQNSNLDDSFRLSMDSPFFNSDHKQL